jgi:leucyl-tRNA synthetase
MEWSDRAIQGVNRFVLKFWTFMNENIEKSKKSKNIGMACDPDFEIVLNKLIQEIGGDIPAMKFNTSVAALMEFYNHVHGKSVCRDCLKKLAVVVAPLIPHIAEEFWQLLGETDSVHQQPWPKIDKALLLQQTMQIPVQINGKVRGKVIVPSDASEDAVHEAVMALESVKRYTEGKDPKKFIYVPGKIATLVV